MVVAVAEAPGRERALGKTPCRESWTLVRLLDEDEALWPLALALAAGERSVDASRGLARAACLPVALVPVSTPISLVRVGAGAWAWACGGLRMRAMPGDRDMEARAMLPTR